MAEDTTKKPATKTGARTSTKKSTLSQKLIEVRKTVDYLQKSTQGTQFNYTSSSQVLSAVREKMNELGLLLTPYIIHSNVRENATKTGTMVYFTELEMNMQWEDTDTGEVREIPWYAQGVDLAGEKGVGKALTYAEKYFILKQFNIPTDKDDPDAFQEKNMPAIDLKTKLIGDLKEAKDIDAVTTIWTKNPKLKSDKDFIEAVRSANQRLSPKDDKK